MSRVLASVRRVDLATIQDAGRLGYAHLGVPHAGALHRARYRMATALITGSVDGAVPAVEILAGRLVLTAAQDIAVTVVGPGMVTVDGHPAANGTVIEVPRAGEASITRAGRGPVYVGIRGWAAPTTLGSASFDTFSGLGGAAIRAGDELRGTGEADGDRRVGAFHRPLEDPTGPIRIVATGHPSLADFLSARWEVTGTARSGVLLAAAGFDAPRESIASMPMVLGAVQLAPSGAAIVLGPDGGLTGGYPVVGVVATVDADRLSLLAPGDLVAFRVVDIGEAAMAHADGVAAQRRALFHPTDLH